MCVINFTGFTIYNRKLFKSFFYLIYVRRMITYVIGFLFSDQEVTERGLGNRGMFKVIDIHFIEMCSYIYKYSNNTLPQGPLVQGFRIRRSLNIFAAGQFFSTRKNYCLHTFHRNPVKTFCHSLKALWPLFICLV